MSEQIQNKPIRVRVFVDYWNVQLTLNEKETSRSGNPDSRIKIDWKNIGDLLAEKAAQIAKVEKNYSFDGVIIYGSHNPLNDKGKKFKKWMTTWLNRQPSVQVKCLERQAKNPPNCPSCHKPIEKCPACNEKMIGSVEKGVDTFIGTDMIRLAWENAYDIAVLASSDRDFVPAVEFLNSKGIKVIQAGFPPSGVNLATSCWASFDIFSLREKIIRKY